MGSLGNLELFLVDLDGFHDVALLDGQDHVHAAGDLSEYGVSRRAADFTGFELAVDVWV